MFTWSTINNHEEYDNLMAHLNTDPEWHKFPESLRAKYSNEIMEKLCDKHVEDTIEKLKKPEEPVKVSGRQTSKEKSKKAKAARAAEAEKELKRKALKAERGRLARAAAKAKKESDASAPAAPVPVPSPAPVPADKDSEEKNGSNT
ncbi:MAG: hypothetical protein JWO77_3905 [Ilumatobacteraceae bacterium]|nr:hypothetical protein [Ilumatobacteraceae bacterium]MDB5177433.1 hypothetical protein [Candidatus Saccharibacteria bacterium]